MKGVIVSVDATPQGAMVVKGEDGQEYQVHQLGCEANCSWLARLQRGKEIEFSAIDAKDGVIDCFSLVNCDGRLRPDRT